MAFLEVNFFSDVLGMAMSMNVVLPQRTRGNIGVTPGETGAAFPTLWLLHGMSDDHTIWMRRTSIERYAEEHGIAVVMPTTYLGWHGASIKSSSRSFPTVKASISGALSNPFDQIFIDKSLDFSTSPSAPLEMTESLLVISTERSERRNLSNSKVIQ